MKLLNKISMDKSENQTNETRKFWVKWQILFDYVFLN